MNDLIDQALREYVGQPVPPGMEGRILARRRRRSWGWPVLGLVAASVGLMCLFSVRPGEPLRVAAPRSFVSDDARQKPGGRAEALPHKRRKESGIQGLWEFAQAHPEADLEFHEPEPLVPLQIEPIAGGETGDIE